MNNKTNRRQVTLGAEEIATLTYLHKMQLYTQSLSRSLVTWARLGDEQWQDGEVPGNCEQTWSPGPLEGSFLLFLVSFFHKPHKTFPEKIQRTIRASLIFQNYNWEQQLLQEIQETDTLNFYFLYGMKALICERNAITL